MIDTIRAIKNIFKRNKHKEYINNKNKKLRQEGWEYRKYPAHKKFDIPIVLDEE